MAARGPTALRQRPDDLAYPPARAGTRTTALRAGERARRCLHRASLRRRGRCVHPAALPIGSRREGVCQLLPALLAAAELATRRVPGAGRRTDHVRVPLRDIPAAGWVLR